MWETSPDSTCLINLNIVRRTFLYDFPVLYNKTHALEKGWFEYIEHVYGKISEYDFPIDLRCKTFWWKKYLPYDKSKIFHKNIHNRKIPRNGDVIDIGKQKLSWQVYLYENQEFKKSEKLLKALKPNTWVEIFHDFNDCEQTTPLKNIQVGYWTHFAPGSGVFLNLGKTFISDGYGYRGVCKLVSNSTDCEKCCTPSHKIVRKELFKKKYTTLQSCCGKRGGSEIRHFEITFIEDTCPNKNGGCTTKSRLRTGIKHDKDCNCNFNYSYSNCNFNSY